MQLKSTQPKPKPDDSKIEEIDQFGGLAYCWILNGGILRFFLAAFLGLWLCGWFFAFVLTVCDLVQGNPNMPRGFMALWLIGWAVGGVVAVRTLFTLIGPPIPECVTLNADTFCYDSGTTPLAEYFNSWWVMSYVDRNDPFRKAFKSRRHIEIPKSELGKVVLERVGERQCLYFDHKADRIEIGEQLCEPDREWLAEVIHVWQSS